MYLHRPHPSAKPYAFALAGEERFAFPAEVRTPAFGWRHSSLLPQLPHQGAVIFSKASEHLPLPIITIMKFWPD